MKKKKDQKNDVVEKSEKSIDGNIFLKYEINMLDHDDLLQTFDVEYKSKTFEYKKKTYNIDSKLVYYIQKTIDKENFYIPTLYYKRGEAKPLDIKNFNEGIPARALYLLWNHALYSVIVTFETDKANKLIILLLLINGIIMGITLYIILKGMGY